METSLEHDDVRLASRRARQFDRSFQSLGTGVAEKVTVYGRMDDRPQFGNQLHHWLVNNDVGLRVDKQPGLLTNSLHHLGVTVTRIGYADPACEIEILFSIAGKEIAPFGAFSLNREDPRPNWRHVGKVFFK